MENKIMNLFKLFKLITIVITLFFINSSILFAGKISNCKNCSSSTNETQIKKMELIPNIWDKNKIPSQIKNDLLGIGINSVKYWWACNTKGMKKIDILHHKKVLKDGWKHITFIVCIDHLFDKDHNLNKYPVKFLFRNLKEDLGNLGLLNSDKTVVISLKGEEKIKPNPSGLNELVFTRKYENNQKLRETYLKLWEMFEKKFINNSNIVFNLYNEPDYHSFKGTKGQSLWFAEVNKIIKIIRDINPNRTVMVEGTNKSLFRRYGFDIMKKVNYANVIYGFHYYPYSGKRFQKKTSKINRNKLETMNNKNSKLLMNYSIENEMPVILSEVGGHSPFKNSKGEVIKGMLEDDYLFYIKSIKNNFFNKGIGITWWATYDAFNTPYKRLPRTKKNINRGDVNFKDYIKVLINN